MGLNFLNYIRDNKASVMSLSAIIMPMVLGVMGIGVDASLWLKDKRNLQAAVDAAVISAAYEIINGATDAEASSKGVQEAVSNGFLNGSSDEFNLSVSETDSVFLRRMVLPM
jgi:uncharacterized membrane protein